MVVTLQPIRSGSSSRSSHLSACTWPRRKFSSYAIKSTPKICTAKHPIRVLTILKISMSRRCASNWESSNTMTLPLRSSLANVRAKTWLSSKMELVMRANGWLALPFARVRVSKSGLMAQCMRAIGLTTRPMARVV